MRKLSVDYFGFALLTIPIILILAVGFVVIKSGYSYSPNYRLDFTGTGLVVGGIFIVLVELWELLVLINFLSKDINKQLVVSDSEIRICEKIYKLKDLKELELVDGVFGTRLLTAHLTYSKLKFSNSDEILLTSFISSIGEVEKRFGVRGVRKVTRSRKRFELIT